MRSVLGQENVASAAASAAVTIQQDTVVNNSKIIQNKNSSSPYIKIKSNVINQIELNRTEPCGSLKEINRS